MTVPAIADRPKTSRARGGTRFARPKIKTEYSGSPGLLFTPQSWTHLINRAVKVGKAFSWLCVKIEEKAFTTLFKLKAERLISRPSVRDFKSAGRQTDYTLPSV